MHGTLTYLYYVESQNFDLKHTSLAPDHDQHYTSTVRRHSGLELYVVCTAHFFSKFQTPPISPHQFSQSRWPLRGCFSSYV